MRAAGEGKKYTASLPVVPFFEYYFMDKPYAF